MQRGEKRELAGAPEPIARIIEVAFPPMDHPVPIGGEIARRLLKNPVAAVQIVERIKQPSANQRKRCRDADGTTVCELRIGGVADIPPQLAVENVGRQELAQQAVDAKHPIDRFRVTRHVSKVRRGL